MKKQTKKAAVEQGQAAVKTSSSDFDICRDALKVKWSYSRFIGDMHSDGVEHSAAAANGAQKDSIIGKVRLLMRKDTATLNSVCREAQQALKMRSLPWEDGGWRLVKSTEYEKVRSLFEELARKFSDALDDIIARYDDLKKDAVARLNSLENGMFPTREELRAKYGFRMFEDVLVKSSDIRLNGMSTAELESLKASIEQRVQEQYSEAQKDIILRITEAVQKLHERIAEVQKPKAKGEKNTTFKKDKETGKYPIFTNVDDILAIADSLNFSNDAKIAQVVASARKQLANVDPEQVKTSKLAQEKVLDSTKSILDELAAF